MPAGIARKRKRRRRRKQPWTEAHARRLLWRAGFGATSHEASELARAGKVAALGVVLHGEGDKVELRGPGPRVNGTPLDPINEFDHDVLWWLDRMVRTSHPLQERMTLFWHGHFATAENDAPLMIAQNETLRRHALGPLARKGVAEHLASKLWAELVGAPLRPETRRKLVREFQRSGRSIRTLIAAILRAPAVYDELGRPDQVKSPVVFVAGLLRSNGWPVPARPRRARRARPRARADGRAGARRARDAARAAAQDGNVPARLHARRPRGPRDARAPEGRAVMTVEQKIRVAAAVAAVGVITAPAVAQGATKSVVMGPTPKVSKSIEKYFSDLNNFYPGNVSVREGDKVRFIPYGLHNAGFPRKGGKPVALRARAGTISGAVDAAGARFWFNGRPTFGLNPALSKSFFGKTVRFTGAKAVDSGLPLADRPKPFTVKFAKRGTFSYFCSVHPGMKGKVTVKAARANVPSAKADATRGVKAMTDDAKGARGLIATKAPDKTVLLGSSNAHGVESFGIFPGGLPGKITVPAGTTVDFRMKSTSREAHTATFGPGNPAEPKSYLGSLAVSVEASVIDGRAIYSSERPSGTPTVYTPALHGNGFWNSGVLDADTSSPLPAAARVTFGQAGSFPFYCLIHPFMTGTVTVT